MQASITVRRLTLASVIKVMMLGNLFSVVPFFVLMGVLTFLGLPPPLELTWNNQPLVGLPALLASPFFGLFVTAFLGLIVGAFTFAGLWLYSLFRPLEIFYLPLQSAPPATGAP